MNSLVSHLDLRSTNCFGIVFLISLVSAVLLFFVVQNFFHCGLNDSLVLKAQHSKLSVWLFD